VRRNINHGFSVRLAHSSGIAWRQSAIFLWIPRLKAKIFIALWLG
jgi:hypothetical protein